MHSCNFTWFCHFFPNAWLNSQLALGFMGLPIPPPPIIIIMSVGMILHSRALSFFIALCDVFIDETVFCNSSSVNRTAYEILSNVRLKVYCPHGNQLNVRLALAGQTTYLVERSNTNDVQNTPQGTVQVYYKFTYLQYCFHTE